MANINLGFVQFSLGEIAAAVTSPFRFIAGTNQINGSIAKLEKRIIVMTEGLDAMKEVLQVLVADASGDWTPEQRREVQSHIANFSLINLGLGELRPSGNPITEAEIEVLKDYVKRAERGEKFTPQEGKEFRRLAEIAATERPGENWTKDLLSLALIVFGMYVLAQIFEEKSA